jgi:polyferredoxin
MKKIRRAYQYFLTPFIMIAAVILFILDNLNVNVTPLVSYILKESKQV